MFQTLQYVNAALARVQTTLPPTAKLTANRLTFAAFPILAYSLTSDTLTQTQLWELANYTIKPRLNRVNGVSMVVLQGGQVPEFHIVPDPAKLLQAQVTVPGILDAVAKTNMIDSPGLIENNHELSLTLVTGQAKDPAEIGNIVVRTTPSGEPIRIADIADVNTSVMPVYTMVTANGTPAVLLNIFRQPDSNTVAVADLAAAELNQIRQTLPSGVKVQTFYDQSTLVRDSINSVRDAILIGLILAAIILVLFLRDWGSSLVAALVIPATIAITLIAMRLMGQGFNLMTLGGLAAAVGLVIDDAIVVVENIVMHRDSGQSRARSDSQCAARNSRAAGGVDHHAHRGVSSADHHHRRHRNVLPRSGDHGGHSAADFAGAGGHLDAHAEPLFPAPQWVGQSRRIADAHGHVAATGFMGRVHAHLRARPAFRAGASARAGAGLRRSDRRSFLCYRALGSDLLPEMDEGGFILDYLMPAGSSLADTNDVLLGVEKILAATPEVESTSRRTGLQLGLAAVTEANTRRFLGETEARPRPRNR